MKQLCKKSKPAISKPVYPSPLSYCRQTLHVQAHGQVYVGFSYSTGRLGERAVNSTYSRQLTWGGKIKNTSYWIWVCPPPGLRAEHTWKSLPVLHKSRGITAMVSCKAKAIPREHPGSDCSTAYIAKRKHRWKMFTLFSPWREKKKKKKKAKPSFLGWAGDHREENM